MRATLRTQGRSDDLSELDAEISLALMTERSQDPETEVPFDDQVWIELQ